MKTRFEVRCPAEYLDRLGRVATVECIAEHNPNRWMGIAGDGLPACWESNGVMEASLPSDIDLVAPNITAKC
jgi:hypothetical protein